MQGNDMIQEQVESWSCMMMQNELEVACVVTTKELVLVG